MKNQSTSMPEVAWRPSYTGLGAPVMTFQQVADALGVSDTCVMHTERRAIAKLRRILAERLGPDDFEATP